MLEESEVDLVRRAAGSDVAMSQLLMRHSDRLLCLIRRNLPLWMDRYADADDVLQETFAKACRGFPTFKYEGAGSTYRWLAAIARNHILNLIEFHRAACRRAVFPVNHDGSDLAASILYLLSHGERSPGALAADKEGVEQMRRAIASLGPAEHQAIRLRYLEGHGVATTARLLDRTPRAVHELTYRALRALRSKLRGSSFEKKRERC